MPCPHHGPSPIAFSSNRATYLATTGAPHRVLHHRLGDVGPRRVHVHEYIGTDVRRSDGGMPPRVHGTITSENKGTKASRAKGCTDYVETEAVGNSPPLAPRRYVAGRRPEGTLSVTSSTPTKLAPVGTTLTLGG